MNSPTPDRTDTPRVCMITGPTSGLGRALALALAKRGFQLVLVGRSETKLAELAALCQRLGAPAPLRIVCDMASQADVRRAADTFLSAGLPLHVLVNNAGLINRYRRLTVDGLEETLAVGYFSAFLLTLRLAERLVASAPSQVINTTSDTYPFGKLPLDDLTFERGYGPLKSYAASKLALVQFTRMLAERLGPHGVRVNVYNPGMNYTNLAIGNNAGLLTDIGDFFWRRIAGPVEAGIAVPLALITEPAHLATQGQLFMRGTQAEPTRAAKDPFAGAALWELSENVTGARLPAPLVPQPRRESGKRLRIGVLGAARITPFTLFKHVRSVSGIEIAALAEEYKPLGATAEYARKYGISKVYRRFDKLLADPEIDAVYLALPNSMHAEQALACIAAGKHLLCEKPLAANADEARRIDAAQRGSGLIVVEAMHMLQHPLAARLRAILESGEIGELERIDAGFSAYIPQKDFRFAYALGGGCMLDMGCYPVAFLRAVLGTEPTVQSARATLVAPKVDGCMESKLAFSNAPEVRMFVGMRSLRRPLEVSMRFFGTHGTIDLLNFIKPEVYHRLVVRSRHGRRVERVAGSSTYETQLRAFVASVRDGAPVRTTTADAVGTLAVIDAIYEKAGLPARGLPG